MSILSIPKGMGRVHAHLRLLLLLTVLVRGGMFLGYPFQIAVDDDQRYQRYLIDRLLEGDLLIGNVRYNTGYPLVIAPVTAASRLFGRLDDRFVLLVQISCSALIPFLLYDIVRRHHSRRAALLVALLTLLDPFGLQWAHLSLPVWLVAFCFVLALWIMDRALHRGISPSPFLVAGVILGVAVLARLNFAPIVALTGAMLLIVKPVPLRNRLTAFIALGSTSALVPVLYMLLIHFPSTGTFSLNCLSGTNLLLSLQLADIPLVAGNGDATARLLYLNALPANSSLDSAQRYANWQRPGPWVSPEEQAAFLAQGPAEVVPASYDYYSVSVLEWYLGPCGKDPLLVDAAVEAFVAHPLQFFQALPAKVLRSLHHDSSWRLPHSDTLRFEADSEVPFPLPRARSREGRAYLENRVWPAPVKVYSHTRDTLNLIKLLILPALVGALAGRRRLYRQAAMTLLVWLFMLALISSSSGRIYAPLWPLWPLLIGGMLADLWQGLSVWAGAGRESARPSR